MVATAPLLSEHLESHHAWKHNEATMVANLLVPILERLRPATIELRAECRVEIDLGRQHIKIDSKQSTLAGRADFFVVDGTSGHVLVVVEAKPPDEELSDGDRTQLGTYMGAVRPLAPFGILTNGRSIEVHGWLNGKTGVVQADGTLDTSIAISLDEALRAQAVRLLLRDSPRYRDQVLSQLSRGELKHVLPASRSPRALLRELLSRVERGDRGVVFVVSPPQCGRTQLLVDLAAALPDETPLAFGSIRDPNGTELEGLLRHLDPGPSSGEPAFVEYLRARAKLAPLCVLLDCHAASSELHRVLGAIANGPEVATLAVVCAPYSVVRDLLFFPDFTARLPDDIVTLYEMAGFSDEELVAIFPTYEARLGSEPFWRLLRWPGIHTVLRTESLPGLHLGEALGRWFRDRPPAVASALDQLGRLLACDETKNLERIPDALPEHLKRALLDAGLAVQVPRRAGFDYRLACIEVGMFALLGHVFDTSDGPRREVLTRIVDRARPNSEAETVALMALLPYFLVGAQPAGQLERIVQRMVAIAFASYVLEGLDRSGLYRALQADLAAVEPPANALLADDARPLYQALLRVRERVGIMPDFREVERMFGESFRRFGDRAVDLSRLRLTTDDLTDVRILQRLKMVELLDALDLLAKGNTSWMIGASGEDDILRVGRAISGVIEPASRRGMPIESSLAYLNGVITRNGPEDIVVLLKRERAGRTLARDSHREALAMRTVEAYAGGHWEPLADAFCYSHATPPWLRGILVGGLVARGAPLSFGRVFLNGVQAEFDSLDAASRRSIGDRLACALASDAALAANISTNFLRTLAETDADVYGRLVDAMRRSGSVLARIRLLALDPPGEKRAADLVRVLAHLEMQSMWPVLGTEEFWSIHASTPDLLDRFISAAAGGADGAALAVELLSLLTRDDRPVVPARKRPKEWPRIRASLRTFLEHGHLTTFIGLGWDRKGCTACAEHMVARLLGDGPDALDRALRSALLNVHASMLAAELVHRTTAPKQLHSRDVSATVLKRLVKSGFDLWEVQLPDPAAPMLHALIERQLKRSTKNEGTALLIDLAQFVVRRWYRLRQLPNPHYTLREIIFAGELGTILLLALVRELAEGSGTRSAFWFLSDARTYLTDEGRTRFADCIDALLARAPAGDPSDAPSADWATLAASLRGLDQLPLATVPATIDATVLMSEVSRVLEAAPLLPSLPPAWNAEPRARSMVQAFPGGFREWEVIAFQRSLLRYE